MARWLIIPVLGCIVAAGGAQAQTSYKPDGLTVPAPASEASPTQRRVYRAPAQTYVEPAPAFQQPPPAYAGRASQRPSPSDPYRGVTLPRQSGDAAYQGGGVVLEQDDNGVNRRIR
jgi:hypothetical protein